MIGMLIKILPYALIMFLMYKALKEPIFFLGVPFLMFIGSSIFIENVGILYKPNGIGADMSLLIWLLIFWTISTNRIFLGNSLEKNKNLKRSFNILDFFVMSLLILSIFGLLNISRIYSLDRYIFIQFFVLCGLSIGYFVIKDIVLTTDLVSLRNFLRILLLINTVGAVLYVLHQGLHITIYQGEEYLEETFNGQSITRTFWFMPVLLPFSIAYLVVFENKKSAFFISVLVINLLAVFITYTRSILMNVILIAVLYFIFTGIKSKQILPVIKNFAVMGILALVFFFAVKTFLPVNASYFLSRFDQIKDEPQDKESNSLLLRIDNTQNIINNIDVDKIFLGSGPITESESYLVKTVKAVTADLVWTGVFFRWGILGFIFLLMLHVFAIYKSWKLYLNTEGLLSQLALLSLLIIISQIIEGFAGYTFMKPNTFALGFWYFGMLSALIIYPDKQNINQKS